MAGPSRVRSASRGPGEKPLGASPTPPAPQGAALMPPACRRGGAPAARLCPGRPSGGEEVGAAPRPPPRTAPRRHRGGRREEPPLPPQSRSHTVAGLAAPPGFSGFAAALVRRAAHPAAQASDRSW